MGIEYPHYLNDQCSRLITTILIYFKFSNPTHCNIIILLLTVTGKGYNKVSL